MSATEAKDLESRKRDALKCLCEFVSKVKNLIESISAESLIEGGGINPYMVKTLGMKSIKEAVNFFVHRRVERSLGTSFGIVLDNLIRVLLGGMKGKDLTKQYGNWIGWWDAVLPDRKIVISIKSGPADMDKDQVLYFAERAREARKHGFRPFLVFAYGKHAFPVIERYLREEGFPPDEYLRIGREIFEEFLLDSEYYKEVLRICEVAGKDIGDVFELIEKKIESLTEELEKRYQGSLDRLLENTL